MDRKEKIELVEPIISLLKTYFSDKNFSFNKVLWSFEKNGTEIHWGESSSYPDSITIMPTFKVKNEDINSFLKNVIQPEFFSPSCSLRAQSLTFANEFGFSKFNKSPFVFIGEGGEDFSIYQYSIKSGTDPLPIFEDHVQFLEKVAFPYLESVNSTEKFFAFFYAKILENIKEDALYDESKLEWISKSELLSTLSAGVILKESRTSEILSLLTSYYQTSEWYLKDIEKFKGRV
jgi:hypothetical protein